MSLIKNIIGNEPKPLLGTGTAASPFFDKIMKDPRLTKEDKEFAQTIKTTVVEQFEKSGLNDFKAVATKAVNLIQTEFNKHTDAKEKQRKREEVESKLRLEDETKKGSKKTGVKRNQEEVDTKRTHLVKKMEQDVTPTIENEGVKKVKHEDSSSSNTIKPEDEIKQEEEGDNKMVVEDKPNHSNGFNQHFIDSVGNMFTTQIDTFNKMFVEEVPKLIQTAVKNEFKVLELDLRDYVKQQFKNIELNLEQAVIGRKLIIDTLNDHGEQQENRFGVLHKVLSGTVEEESELITNIECKVSELVGRSRAELASIKSTTEILIELNNNLQRSVNEIHQFIVEANPKEDIETE